MVMVAIRLAGVELIHRAISKSVLDSISQKETVMTLKDQPVAQQLRQRVLCPIERRGKSLDRVRCGT